MGQFSSSPESPSLPPPPQRQVSLYDFLTVSKPCRGILRLAVISLFSHTLGHNRERREKREAQGDTQKQPLCGRKRTLVATTSTSIAYYTTHQSYYINHLFGVILCNGQASVQYMYVTMPATIPQELVCVCVKADSSTTELLCSQAKAFQVQFLDPPWIA